MLTMRPRHPIVEAIDREFRDWQRTLTGRHPDPHPYPAADGGLPEGWTIRASRDSSRPHSAQEVFLVSRRDGGWIALRHTFAPPSHFPGHGKSIPNHFEATLDDLYAKVCRYTDLPDWRNSAAPYEAMIRDFIHAAYDTTDADEQAEHLLVTLGARPRALPASLR